MIDLSNFKLWLTENKVYSDKTISNIVSRFKRADGMLPWFNDRCYCGCCWINYLEKKK